MTFGGSFSLKLHLIDIYYIYFITFLTYDIQVDIVIFQRFTNKIGISD